ncbi:MAG: RNA-binding protein [Pseudanabaena sp. RU_4_16]|nr:RNA-binding protein [Pseudanabaena sp. RU_4_16]
MSDNPGQQWLQDLLGRFALEANVSTDTPALSNSQLAQSSGAWLTIDAEALSSEQVQVLTDKGMALLDAIQYLLNSTLNIGKSEEERQAYTVEVGSARVQRYEELSSLATEAALQVREHHDEHEMPALSGAERRLIHTILGDEADLKTFSRGEGSDRRLIICPADVSEG